MIDVTVPARLARVGELRAALAGLDVYYADQAYGPSPTEVYAWGLALHEAATNVVRHGHGGDSNAPITLTIEPAPDHVVFVLQDTGRPNPAWPYRPPGRPVLDEGGYGLQIIHRVMDEVRYHRDPAGRNVLTLVARLKAGAARMGR
jgi:serine/threonine-protein kinase RsbW